MRCDDDFFVDVVNYAMASGWGLRDEMMQLHSASIVAAEGMMVLGNFRKII